MRLMLWFSLRVQKSLDALDELGAPRQKVPQKLYVRLERHLNL